MGVRGLAWLAIISLVSAGQVYAEESSVEQAREALSKKEDDADSTKALEEVFQAAEQSYTLLKKGERTLTYGFDYSLTRDMAIQTVRTNQDSQGVPSYSVIGQSEAQHSFTNAFTFDYGVWDNLTFSVRLPLVAKYDTERDLDVYSIGDLSTSLRWQPWNSVRGRPVTTFYANLGFPTGESPYDININRDLSTGNGYYSLGLGPTSPMSSTRSCSSVRWGTPTTRPSRTSTRCAVDGCWKRFTPAPPSRSAWALPTPCPMTCRWPPPTRWPTA